MLQNKNDKDELEDFSQYYFIDSRNKIQILYPNYDQKVERVKVVEMISNKFNIGYKNASIYKKITYIDESS